jgi:hypothetical protein
MAAARRQFFGRRAGADSPVSQYAPPQANSDPLGFHHFGSGMSPYAPNPAGRFTNEMANTFFGMHGQMPARTFGGNFGAALPNPDNRLVGQQLFGPMRGNPYGPMNSAPLQNAPTNTQGYTQQMLAQNPHGTFFGGALPAYGSTPGGRRPMFMGPPALPAQGMSPGQQANFAADTGNYYNPQTGVMGGTNQVMDMTHRQFLQGAMRGGSGKGPSAETLAQNAAAYGQHRDDVLGFRRFNVFQNARNKRAAMQDRLGIGDPTAAYFRQNPEAAMEQQHWQQQLGLAQQHENNLHSRGMFTAQNNAAANQAKLSGADNQLMGQYIAALPQLVQGGHVTPEQAQAAVADFQRRMFGGGGGGQPATTAAAGKPSLPAMTPQESEQIRRDAQSNPAKAKRDLIAKGATAAEADHAIRAINPNHGRSLLGDVAGMLPDMPWMGVNPYGPAARLFGVMPPSLARPTHPPQSFGVSGSW